jgi:hypothetical protein
MSETADFSARADLLRRFSENAKAFDRLVQQEYPAGLIDFVPPIADAWSIREHIVHVLDADLMAHHRIRYAIAEPGTTVLLWDEGAWKASLGYAKQNVTASVSMIRMLRALTASMLEGLDRETWEKSWSVHPVRGRLTLNDWLGLYAGHVDAHMEYVVRNEAAWEAQGGGDRLPCH